MNRASSDGHSAISEQTCPRCKKPILPEQHYVDERERGGSVWHADCHNEAMLEEVLGPFDG